MSTMYKMLQNEGTSYIEYAAFTDKVHEVWMMSGRLVNQADTIGQLREESYKKVEEIKALKGCIDRQNDLITQLQETDKGLTVRITELQSCISLLQGTKIKQHAQLFQMSEAALKESRRARTANARLNWLLAKVRARGDLKELFISFFHRFGDVRWDREGAGLVEISTVAPSAAPAPNTDDAQQETAAPTWSTFAIDRDAYILKFDSRLRRLERAAFGYEKQV